MKRLNFLPRVRTALALTIAVILVTTEARADGDDGNSVASAEGGSQLGGATLRVFFDVGASARFDDLDSVGTSRSTSLHTGALDLLLTRSIGADVSGLVELVVEQVPGGSWVSDLERVQVRWAPTARTVVEAGRLHTPIGFWNGEYHHGLLFSPLIERPLGLRFEDDGGILPVHFVGVTIEQTFPSSAGGVSLRGGVGNGRGTIPDQVQNLEDLNTNKAIVGRVTASGGDSFDWQVGASHYRESIPALFDGPAAHESIAEAITAAHARLETSGVVLLAEGFLVRHRGEITNDRWKSRSGHVIGSWTFGSWTPYAALDALTQDLDDAFLRPTVGFETRTIAGMRLDADERSSLRLELEWGRAPGRSWHAMTCQWAVAL